MLAITAVGRHPDPPGFLGIAPPCPKSSATKDRRSLSIDNLTLAARLASLYQISFPGRLDLLEQEIDLASEESLSEATARFLQRVESELFPVYWDIWFEVGEMDWCLYNIPIACQGFGVGYDDPADYPEPICLFLRLAERQYFDREDDQAIAEIYPQLVDVPAVILDGIDRLSKPLQDMDLLRPVVARPLAAIPGLIDMVFQQTGNPWLDVSPEMYAESGQVICWDAETVAELAALWLVAKPTLEGVWELTEWVAEDPAERLREVMNTLLTAYRKSP
jgi:hypothetical protein